MQKIKVSDEWLYKYMPVVDEAIIGKIESQIDHSHEFTKKFQKRMKRLAWSEAHPWMTTITTFTKRVAVIFICTITFLFGTIMSVEALREKFFETIKTFWEDSVQHKYFTSGMESTKGVIEPLYIPEGYELVEKKQEELFATIEYRNSKGDEIRWIHWKVTDSLTLILDTEYDSREEKAIDGVIISFFIYDKGAINAYWEYDQYVFQVFTENLKLEEICKIIESTIK